MRGRRETRVPPENGADVARETQGVQERKKVEKTGVARLRHPGHDGDAVVCGECGEVKGYWEVRGQEELEGESLY